MNTIRHYIINNIIDNISDDDSIAIIWDKLKKIYMTKNLNNKLYLKQKIYKLRMEKDKDLVEHLNILKKILNQLQKVDVKINEENIRHYYFYLICQLLS